MNSFLIRTSARHYERRVQTFEQTSFHILILLSSHGSDFVSDFSVLLRAGLFNLEHSFFESLAGLIKVFEYRTVECVAAETVSGNLAFLAVSVRV